MPSVAIIGASRGIGLALAQQYAGLDWHVHATHRVPEPLMLAAVKGVVSLHRADVGCAGDISRLREALAGEPIDVLIHNAGIHDRDYAPEEVMRINAEAPLEVVAALMPNLLLGAEKKLLLMSSQMGARRGRTGSLGVYGDSKAALNDRFRAREPDWKKQGITAIVLHPGWVRTDMGGASAPVAVEDSARGVVRVLERLQADDGGKFLTWEGVEHPW